MLNKSLVSSIPFYFMFHLTFHSTKLAIFGVFFHVAISHTFDKLANAMVPSLMFFVASAFIY